MGFRVPRSDEQVTPVSKALRSTNRISLLVIKKPLYLLATLALGGLILAFIIQALQSTAYVRTYGRDGVLVIGQRYSGSRLATPLPLKRVHNYTALLEPRYQVVIETDQELVENRTYTLRFLTRDRAAATPYAQLRPIPGSIKLRHAADPAPVKQETTAQLDWLLSKAMGSSQSLPDESSPVSAPDVSSGAVPFLLTTGGDNFVETLWANSRLGEWVFLLLALLLFNALCKHAWNLPWSTAREKTNRKDFVHPSLRTVDPDPQKAQRPPIVFNQDPARSEVPPPLPSNTRDISITSDKESAPKSPNA